MPQVILYRIFITVLLSSLFFTASAQAELINMRKKSLSEIEQIVADLDPHFKTLERSLQNPTDPKRRSVGEDHKAIRELAKVGLYESARAIWIRLKADVVAPMGMRDKSLRDRAVEALITMVSQEDAQIFDDMNYTYEEIQKYKKIHPKDEQYLTILSEEFKIMIELIKGKDKNTPALPTYEELRLAPMQNREHAKNDLARFHEILKKKIKGQPEVIEALMALEWESRFIQNNEPTPDIIYLMGSPGTGKDTTAQALADAAGGYEGAYKSNMFSLPLMTKQPDLWQVLGSATGYIGSTTLPPFLQFLVDHSGGQYVTEKGAHGVAIKENPQWKGEYLPGHKTPDQAVVYVNEFHNWSKDIKDVLIKQALEKGIFNINNPAGGLAEIRVPVRFVIASNEGISLVSSREASGARFGDALTYEQMMDKWERVQADKKRLKAEIMMTNGAARGESNRITGISEELLNRIDDRYVILMRPLSPESLKGIALANLDKAAKNLINPTQLNPGFKITWDDSVVTFVQEYDYDPEDNARPMKGKTKSLIIETLVEFLKEYNIDAAQQLNLEVKIVTNDDGTSSLQILVSDKTGKKLGDYAQLIKVTEKDKAKAVVSDEVIERLSNLAAKIKSRVFGVDIIADRIAERVVSLANQTVSSKKAARNASTLVLMGLSSTGKTELSKAITEALTGDEKNALVIDFSQVQSMHDFKTRILGTRDYLGNATPSDFMMHYDRLDGDIVVVFDELSNVKDPDLLKSLYDFFREPVLSTFSDGKPRVMSRVKVIVTGNSGIELYKNVPRTVSMAQQMASWEEISKALIRDEEAQRAVLEKSFPEPLINRWGMNNVFFVPPHTYKSLKQLAGFKLLKAFEGLKPQDGRRGWDIAFANQEEAAIFIHKLIDRAFRLREQGASIDSYVKDEVAAHLEAKLLLAKVPTGTKVQIKLVGEKFVVIASKKIVTEFTFKKPKMVDSHGHEEDEDDDEELQPSETDQILTAYHEVGHAIAAKLLFKDQRDPVLITIEPGVAKIGGQFIAYAGVAKSKFTEKGRITREAIIRSIAVMAAGETAERLVTIDEVHSGGKSNDMERATALAQAGVLVYGLSEEWGTETLPTGVEMEDFISRFSEEKKRRFETEVKKFLDEGRQMAREILELNFDRAVVPMAKELAEKLTLTKKDMAPYFENASLLPDSWSVRTMEALKKMGKKIAPPKQRSALRDGVIKSDDLKPRFVGNVRAAIEKRKQAQFDEVAIQSKFTFANGAEFSIAETADCVDLLTSTKKAKKSGKSSSVPQISLQMAN